jgi:hypothetical protein
VLLGHKTSMPLNVGPTMVSHWSLRSDTGGRGSRARDAGGSRRQTLMPPNLHNALTELTQTPKPQEGKHEAH